MDRQITLAVSMPQGGHRSASGPRSAEREHREPASGSTAGCPVSCSELVGGELERRSVTRTLPGRFSNWPRIHTGPLGPDRLKEKWPLYRLVAVPVSAADLVARQASKGLSRRLDWRSVVASPSRTNSCTSSEGWAAMVLSTCSASPSMVQSGPSGAPRRSVMGLLAVTMGLPVSGECAIRPAVHSARFQARTGSRRYVPSRRRSDRRRESP